jgi:hypothetical protein
MRYCGESKEGEGAEICIVAKANGILHPMEIVGIGLVYCEVLLVC